MPHRNDDASVAIRDYPELRQILAPPYRALPAEDLEMIFEHYGLVAEDMESFLDTLKGFGKAVASIAPTILPTVGTIAGTAAGGPAGAAVGGALGRVAGGVINQLTDPSKSQKPPINVPGIGGVQSNLPPLTPQTPPGAAPAASQLLQIMFRPETMQALLAMILGQLGRSNIPVGNTPVPVSAFPNLLGTLANQAQTEHIAARPTTREDIPEYLRTYAGEAMVDPAVAEARAGALYELLQETDVEPISFHLPRMAPRTAYPLDPFAEQAFYDELELAEYYSEDDL